jgi:hypothetical protein
MSREEKAAVKKALQGWNTQTAAGTPKKKQWVESRASKYAF